MYRHPIISGLTINYISMESMYCINDIVWGIDRSEPIAATVNAIACNILDSSFKQTSGY